MVTRVGSVDVIDVASSTEALEVMLSLHSEYGYSVEEVPATIAFRGLPVSEVVIAYAAFQKETGGADVIEFSSRGKKRLWKGVA